MTFIPMLLMSLAVLTSFACTALLLRSYSTSGERLLLWSALCFVCLSLNNILLFLDLVVWPGPDLDLRPYRLASNLAGILFLLYGFIWEAK
jgi:hypothetical protein